MFIESKRHDSNRIIDKIRIQEIWTSISLCDMKDPNTGEEETYMEHIKIFKGVYLVMIYNHNDG